jgi:hypothetical protein
MRRRRQLLSIAAIALVAALLNTPYSALAHERRTVSNGKYDLVVGWDTEPAYVNQRNAAGIRISKAGTNPAEAVTGAEKTLKVEIRQGAVARTFDLRAVVGQPGYYLADILPTRTGDYVWTFTGSIGADQVNEAFDSADGRFDAVSASGDVAFPVAMPEPDQVAAQLQTAEATARSAQTVAYIGAAFGLLGCLAALLVWLLRPRASTAILSTRDVPVRRAAGGRGIRAG